MKLLVLVYSFTLAMATPIGAATDTPPDYLEYHRKIQGAEKQIVAGDYEGALASYDEVFQTYSFIFLRDYKVAAQLALQLGNRQKALDLIRKGICSGWTLKSIRSNSFLSRLKDAPEWKEIEASYSECHESYLRRIDGIIRERVHRLFKSDQRKAMGALLRIGNRAQEGYALKKFAPHSEQQLRQLTDILEAHGYPGEQLIGNDYWASTILSHHNSISQEYVLQDTLFNRIRPALLLAIQNGTMSPYEFALADDWRIAVGSGHTAPGYGFLAPPRASTLEQTNQLRGSIGLRSIELRNDLVEAEERTGMNFYLPDWLEGSIGIKER